MKLPCSFPRSPVPASSSSPPLHWIAIRSRCPRAPKGPEARWMLKVPQKAGGFGKFIWLVEATKKLGQVQSRRLHFDGKFGQVVSHCRRKCFSLRSLKILTAPSSRLATDVLGTPQTTQTLLQTRCEQTHIVPVHNHESTR